MYHNFVLHLANSTLFIPTLLNKVDMIFADPPYFLSTGNGTVKIGNRLINFDKGDWDRVRPKEEVYDFNYKWLSACHKVLKDDGTIWVCGTYHNIYEVANCLKDLGFKILNMIVWQKSDPPQTLTDQRFNFSAEYIVWARKCEKIPHYFNYELMQSLNNGVPMPDVWKMPAPGMWEKNCGKHPTQKPLRLLHRIILASTRPNELILDPFAGSCTTGIAANLLGRKFMGIDQSREFLDLGLRRRKEIEDPDTAKKMLQLMAESPEEVMVVVNHARTELHKLMIEKGICYMRAGDSKGSVLVTPGFERTQYILIHHNGFDPRMFKLDDKGCFQIWTKETLKHHGFSPEHSSYYMVFRFDKKNEIPISLTKTLQFSLNNYRSKVRPLSDFVCFL